MSGEIFVCGHSLGAADAALYALSRVQRGLRVDGLYMFACPRPGDSAIRTYLRPVPLTRSIKNIGDGVTDVPFDVHVKEMGWAYCDTMPFEHIHETPSFADYIADPFFAHHHITHYQNGVHKMPAEGGAIGIDEAVDLVARLYQTIASVDWTWIDPTDGEVWAVQAMPNGARLAIRRGSKTLMGDWLREDFDFTQEEKYGARVSRGFGKGVWPVEAALDAALAMPIAP